MSEITHLAAQPVRARNRYRQRCAWCGALLFDYDLATIATPDPVEPDWLPAVAEMGGLWTIDGNQGYRREPTRMKDGSWMIAPDFCMHIDMEVTR